VADGHDASSPVDCIPYYFSYDCSLVCLRWAAEVADGHDASSPVGGINCCALSGRGYSITVCSIGAFAYITERPITVAGITACSFRGLFVLHALSGDQS